MRPAKDRFRIAGFHVHRGCLAVGERPAELAAPPGARLLVVLEDLTDVDNLGALARHAAAFGADALVLEIGTRAPGETAYYSDIDMAAQSDGYTHRDGTPYPKTGRRGP